MITWRMITHPVIAYCVIMRRMRFLKLAPVCFMVTVRANFTYEEKYHEHKENNQKRTNQQGI